MCTRARSALPPKKKKVYVFPNSEVYKSRPNYEESELHVADYLLTNSSYMIRNHRYHATYIFTCQKSLANELGGKKRTHIPTIALERNLYHLEP